MILLFSVMEAHMEGHYGTVLKCPCLLNVKITRYFSSSTFYDVELMRPTYVLLTPALEEAPQSLLGRVGQ